MPPLPSQRRTFGWAPLATKGDEEPAADNVCSKEGGGADNKTAVSAASPAATSCVGDGKPGAPAPAPTLRQTLTELAPGVFLPYVLFSTAWGLLSPVLPALCRSLGAADSLIGDVTSCRALGAMVSNVPNGWLIQRVGCKRAVLVGGILYCIGCLGGAASGNISLLMVTRFIGGGAYSLVSVAQQTYIRLVVPPQFRGRVMSGVGGCSRVGSFFGPMLGGVISQRFGYRAPFYCQALACLAAVPLVLSNMSAHEAALTSTPGKSGSRGQAALVAYLRRRWRAIAAVFIAAVSLSFLRGVRELVVPLSAFQRGMSRPEVGYTTSASYLGEVLLFPLSGVLMDKYGRRSSGALSMLLMSAGLALLALRGGSVLLVAAAMLIGVGNALSSGTILTLGADMAPRAAAAQFLGIFVFVSNSGGVGGPALVGELSQRVSLPTAAATAACFGLAGAAWWALALPRTIVGDTEGASMAGGSRRARGSSVAAAARRRRGDYESLGDEEEGDDEGAARVGERRSSRDGGSRRSSRSRRRSSGGDADYGGGDVGALLSADAARVAAEAAAAQPGHPGLAPVPEASSVREPEGEEEAEEEATDEGESELGTEEEEEEEAEMHVHDGGRWGSHGDVITAFVPHMRRQSLVPLPPPPPSPPQQALQQQQLALERGVSSPLPPPLHLSAAGGGLWRTHSDEDRETSRRRSADAVVPLPPLPQPRPRVLIQGSGVVRLAEDAAAGPL